MNESELDTMARCVFIRFLPDGRILFAPSWSRQVAANYWRVICFRDLGRWLKRFPLPIIYEITEENP